MQQLKIVLFSFFFCFALPVVSQTCCTGGTPLTSAINLEPNSGGIRFGLTYDVNNLADFMQNDLQVSNNYLARKTTSIIGQIDFSLTPKTGIAILIPYSFLSEHNSQAETTYKANGLSDISIWASHLVINNKRGLLVLSAGIKLPSGKTDIKDDSGQFDLPVSLQPGTGSVDFIFTTFFKSSFKFRPSLAYFATGLYKINTVGKQYSAHPEYRYSNEIDLYVGVSEEVLIFNQLLTPHLQLRYNSFGEHEQNGSLNSNTGGNWLYLGSGLGWAINSDLVLNFNGLWPIYRQVNGFQLTTTDRYSISLIVNLKRQN